MNDEIKEILEYLKDENEYYDETEQVTVDYGEIILEKEDIDKLLDYISKLEEENKELRRAEEAIVSWKNSSTIRQKKLLEKNKEIERLNNIIEETRQMLYKRMLDDYDTYTANVVCDIQSDFEEIIRLNGGEE